MSYQQKDNSGALFKNEQRTSDTHAHARGTALIDGVAYFVDAWTNEKDGKKYQTLRFKKKDKQGAAKPGGIALPPPSSGHETDFDDVPPF